MTLLSGELLQTRKRFLSTIALDKIHDVLHAFFECNACGRAEVAINLLTGNLHGVMNNLPAMAKLLLDTPERMVADARATTCSCGSLMRLTSVILCRTNPRQANDFHFRVRYYGNEVRDDTFTAAILFPDGRYVQLPHERLVRLLLPSAPTQLGDRLRALREPRPDIDEEERRWDAYWKIVESGEVSQVLLRELTRDVIERLLDCNVELRADLVVQEAVAILALPLDHPDLDRRAAAIEAPMDALCDRFDDTTVKIALDAIRNAAWLDPKDGVIEATANAVQHSAARARRDSSDDNIDPRLLEGGHNGSSIARGLEITAQVEKLIALLDGKPLSKR